MMIEFAPLTRELLRENLSYIMQEVKDFKFIAWQEKNYLLNLPDKWKFSVAAYSDGSISGFSINSNKQGIFYIHFFYVFHKYRSSGLGKNLIDACEKISIENGIKAMQLRCHKDNFRALNFYFQNGFHIAEVDTKMNTQYVLEKNLA